MGSHHRHHTVTEGLLRNWCRPEKRVLLIDKPKRTAKPVGTHDAFVIPKLLTFQTAGGPSNDLEKHFGRIEDKAIPALQRFIAGERSAIIDQHVTHLIALNWARSRSMYTTARRIFASEVEARAEAVEDDDRLRKVFELENARLPHPGELKEIIARNAERLRRANNLFAAKVEEYLRRACEHFGEDHLQRIELGHQNGVEFLLADSPVILMGGSRLQPTADTPTALLEGTGLWLPVSPTGGVTITKDPSTDARVTPADAQILNRLTWNYASSHLAGSLTANLDLALARPAGTIQVTGLPTST